MTAITPAAATPIRVLIADDEPLARHRVRRMLAAHADVDVAGECCDGNEVLAMLEEVRPNVLFLDVAMPELGAFEMLQRLGRGEPPAIVFITAYETFARQAFDAAAVDYLVKPFSQERFDLALERARVFLAGRSSRGAGGPAPRKVLDRLTVRTRSEVFFIPAAGIFWIGAEENYARLYLADRSYLIRESLQYLEAHLDPTVFVRVHRSAIVNVARMRKVVFHAHGCSIVLNNDAAVPLGARYRQRFESFLGEKL